MTPAERAREIARRQNDADAAAGRCSRYVDDPAVLAQVVMAGWADGARAEGGDADAVAY